MNQHPTESNEPDGNTCQSHAPSFAKVLHGRKHRAALPLTRTLRTIRQQLVAADGSRRILFAATMAPTDGRVAQAVRACGKANPEGWKMVAGGRSGERGNDHRETASDDRAPRRGARPGANEPPSGLVAEAPEITGEDTRPSPHVLTENPERVANKKDNSVQLFDLFLSVTQRTLG